MLFIFNDKYPDQRTPSPKVVQSPCDVANPTHVMALAQHVALRVGRALVFRRLRLALLRLALPLAAAAFGRGLAVCLLPHGLLDGLLYHLLQVAGVRWADLRLGRLLGGALLAARSFGLAQSVDFRQHLGQASAKSFVVDVPHGIAQLQEADSEFQIARAGRLAHVPGRGGWSWSRWRLQDLTEGLALEQRLRQAAV